MTAGFLVLQPPRKKLRCSTEFSSFLRWFLGFLFASSHRSSPGSFIFFLFCTLDLWIIHFSTSPLNIYAYICIFIWNPKNSSQNRKTGIDWGVGWFVDRGGKVAWNGAMEKQKRRGYFSGRLRWKGKFPPEDKGSSFAIPKKFCMNFLLKYFLEPFDGGKSFKELYKIWKWLPRFKSLKTNAFF